MPIKEFPSISYFNKKCFTAEGVITEGDPVYQYANGVVRRIGDSVTLADSYEFEDGEVQYASLCYVGSDKFVVFYADQNENGYGYAKVGTIASDHSITYGTRATFFTGADSGHIVKYISCCAIDNSKTVTVFEDDDTGEGYAVVGTVSGTTISFGTPQVWTEIGNDCDWNRIVHLGSDKIVIAASLLGQGIDCICGTISGATITFGSLTDGGIYTDSEIGLCKLGSAKFMMIGGDASEGAVIVAATISGTTITVGSSEIIRDGESCPGVELVYLDTDKALAILCESIVSGDPGWVAVVNVSGTTITVEDLVQFETKAQYARGTSVSSSYAGSIYDYGVAIFYDGRDSGGDGIFCVRGIGVQSDDTIAVFDQQIIDADNLYDRVSGDTWKENKIVVCYSIVDVSGDDDGEARVCDLVFTMSTYFVGFAEKTVSDGEDLNVLTLGDILLTSGLTFQNTYYVDPLGDLTTNSSYTKVGYAMSTTKLLITGGLGT